jgi:hypothetical protein
VDRPPPVPLSRPSPRQKIPRAFLNLPGHPGRLRTRRAPAPLVSGELPRRGCGRRRLSWLEKGTEASRSIPAVHLRSDGPILNNPGPILAVRLESDGPGPLPHTPPSCRPGPACQPLALALPARPRLSAARVRSARPAPPVSRPRLRALARLPADLILSVDPRSDGRRSPIPLRPRNFLKRPPVFCNLTRRPWNFAVRSLDLLYNPE